MQKSPNKDIDSDYFVKSFAKGMSVLETFAADNPTMTPSELAIRLGITRAAARRFLLTLESLGYVKHSDRQFSLTPKILALSSGFKPTRADIWEIALKHMQILVDSIDEGCSAAIMKGTDIEYVARIGTPGRIISVLASLGSRFPAHLTSTGRSILAFSSNQVIDDYITQAEFKHFTEFSTRSPEKIRNILARVKLDGYSIVSQELELGLCSIGIPLLNSNGKILGALTVVLHISRLDETKLVNEIYPALAACAKAINNELDKF